MPTTPTGVLPVHLVLLRHGPAIDRADPDCPADPLRRLTEAGRRRSERAVAGLARLLPEGEVVVHTSPWLRARETATLLCAALGGAQLHDDELLTPGHGAFSVLGHLLAGDADTVVAVGHAPQLDELVAAALGAPCPSLTRLKKAGAACVEAPAHPDAHLAWHLPPRVLRALGDGA